MGRSGASVAIVVLGAASPALAQHAPHIESSASEGTRIAAADRTPVHPTDESLEVALGERWHEVPRGHGLDLEIQITDHLTDIGNLIGASMGDLSHDVVGLKFDGRAQRAKIHLGNADKSFLHFAVDTDWHFTSGKARVATKLQLGIGDHHFKVELPDMDVEPTSVRGERGVEVRVPLIERRW